MQYMKHYWHGMGYKNKFLNFYKKRETSSVRINFVQNVFKITESQRRSRLEVVFYSAFREPRSNDTQS